MRDEKNKAIQVGAPVLALVETVRKSLAHDVRTPLGTIVNYAALLESIEQPQVPEIRGLARKMRDNAMRAATMLQQISGAVGVLARPEGATEVAVGALLYRGMRSATSQPGPRFGHSGGPAHVQANAALLAFVWTSVFRFDFELRHEPPHEAQFEVEHVDALLCVTVWLGARETQVPPPFDIRQLVRHCGDRVSIESRMALELALGLVESVGGRCTLHGELGGDCAVRIGVLAEH
jgi:hypothetical protein